MTVVKLLPIAALTSWSLAFAANTVPPASLAKAYEQAVYAPLSEKGRVSASNPNHNLDVTFDPAAVSLRHKGANALRMRLTGFGNETRTVKASAATPAIKNGRVEYNRQGVTEWYVNEKRGLEQGFTFASAPAGKQGKLVVELAVEGAKARKQNDDLILLEAQNSTINYGGLKSWDATGRELPGKMMVADGRIRLVVNDANAKYPVTVDPFTFQQKVIASDPSASALFGGAVALSSDGNTAVIGAPGTAANVGAAYVFTRSGSTWSFLQKLTATGATSTTPRLGFSAAISGDGNTIALGARSETGTQAGQGAVFTFVKSAGSYAQVQRLVTTPSAANDNFGFSIALSEDASTLVVGASGLDVTSPVPLADVGAVYIYTGTAGNYSGEQKIVNPNPTVSSAGCGTSVDISHDGNYVIFGCPGDTVNSTAALGSSYVYLKSSGTFSQQQRLTDTSTSPAPVTGDRLGRSATINQDGSVAVSCAAQGDDTANSRTDTGFCLLFTRSGATWSLASKFYATTTVAGEAFGTTASLSGNGNALIIGATQQIATNTATGAGALYLFSRSGNTMTQESKYLDPVPALSDLLGSAVDMSKDGTTAAGGASQADCSTTSTPACTASITNNGAVNFFYNPPAVTTVSVNIASNITSAPFTVSGTNCAAGSYTAPQSLTWNVGASCTVTFTTPVAGNSGQQFVFNNWEDSSTNAARTITAPASTTTYTGTYKTQYQLTTASNPVAGGTVSPATGFKDSGSVVSVTQVPNANYVFIGWSGACSGTGACSVTVDAAKTVTANYVLTAQQTVTSSPTGISFTSAGSGCQPGTYVTPKIFTWAVGASCTITMPSTVSGSGTQNLFQQWENATTNPIRVIVGTSTANTYTATYKTQYQLTTAVSPSGAGTISPASGFQDAGAVVSVTTSPNSGNVFASWSGDCSGSGACSVTMTGPKSVTANYGAVAQTVSATISQSALTLNLATGRYRRTFTITNTSGSTLESSALVFDALPSGVAVYQPSGFTSAATPAGSPYVELGSIAAGASVTKTVEFTRSGNQTITYTNRVLGAGAR